MPHNPSPPTAPRVVGVYDRPPWFRRRSVWLVAGTVVGGMLLSALCWVFLLKQG